MRSADHDGDEIYRLDMDSEDYRTSTFSALDRTMRRGLEVVLLARAQEVVLE